VTAQAADGGERPCGMTCAPELECINYEDKPIKDAVGGPVICHPHLRRFVGAVVRATLAERWLIRTDAPPGVEVVVNRREGDLYVHLVNHTCGYIQDTAYFTTDSIPELANIAFEVNLRGRTAQAVQALPEGEMVEWSLTKDGVRVKLPCLRFHVAVCFTGAAQ